MEKLSTTVGQEEGLALLLQHLIRIYFVKYFCTCLISNRDESITYFHPIEERPVILMKWDPEDEEKSLERLKASIENGCQAYIVTQAAIFGFLDSYRHAHDVSLARFPNKPLVVILENSMRGNDTMNRILEHPTTEDTPLILIVEPQQDGCVFNLFTSKYVGLDYTSAVLLDRFYCLNSTFEKGVDLFSDKKLLDFQGKPIKLAIFNYLPYTLWHEATDLIGNSRDLASNTSLWIAGTESLVFLEFCLIFNCTLEISLDEDGEWGLIYDNRTGNGIIGAVVERRAEIGVGALYSWYHEFNFLSLSKPISRTGITCITPRPHLLPFWLTPLLPFSYPLWLAVLASFIFGIIGLRIVDVGGNYIPNDIPEKTSSLGATIIKLTGVYLGQAAQMRNPTSKDMHVWFGILIIAMMIGYIYSGAIINVMTVPRYEQGVDTVEELAASRMNWLSTHDAWIFSIELATQPTILTLLANFKTFPKETLEMMAKMHKYSFSIERLPWGHYAIGEYITEKTANDYQMMLDDIYWENCVAMSTKTWPLLPQLDDLILRISESGIQKYWEYKTVVQHSDNKVQSAVEHSRDGHESIGPTKLQPEHLLGAFFTLGFGLLASFIAFIGEVIVYRARKSKIVTPEEFFEEDPYEIE